MLAATLAGWLALPACAHRVETMTFAEAGIVDPDDATDPPEPPEEEPGAPAAAQALHPAAGPRGPWRAAPAPVAPPPGTVLPPSGAVPPPPEAVPADGPALGWPLDGAWVSSRFGMRRHPLDGAWRMHWGLDLSARAGRAVGSAGPGLVVRAGWAHGYGLLVEVRHGGGVVTRYSHLARVLCRPGDAVESGQALGLVGSTGRATGPHLHFEVWQHGQPRDPLAVLEEPPWAAPVAWRGGFPGRARAQP
jgi:murein DD-endopeptidase MepM/ murein hydrolase activator NlpD